MKKILIYLVIAGVVGFVLLQLVPYGRNHVNPPVVSEPQWDSPQTRQIAVDACFACHSNETKWPWYSSIAPGSWLVYHDVVDGRERFNFSDWANNPGELREMTKVIERGNMPPSQYLLLHPEAKLTDQQKADFIAGLQATVK